MINRYGVRKFKDGDIPSRRSRKLLAQLRAKAGSDPAFFERPGIIRYLSGWVDLAFESVEVLPRDFEHGIVNHRAAKGLLGLVGTLQIV